MAQFPALPLFTDAYMADTRHLTAAQHGAYLLLLMTAWRMPNCSLPDDDKLLARWSCLGANWLKHKEIIMGFWRKDAQGNYFQPRLSDERNHVALVREKNISAGRVSALKRKKRHSTDVPTEPQRKSNPLNPTLPLEPLISPLSRMLLTELPLEWAAWVRSEMGWAANVVNDVWLEFKEYWTVGKGKKTKREDWMLTWRSWCRKQNLKTSYSKPTAAKQNVRQL